MSNDVDLVDNPSDITIVNQKIKLEEELKKRIPEFQQGDNDLTRFLEVAGEYLDRVRAKIDQLQYSYDYQHSTLQQLNLNAKSNGVEFPITLPDEVLRLVVRDIVEVYRLKGTNETIKWLFRIMDLDVEIREAWLLNPREYEGEYSKTVYVDKDYNTDGAIYGHKTFGDAILSNGGAEGWQGAIKRYEPTDESEYYYIEPPEMVIDTSTFLYGKVNVYDDGTFFDGEDIFENKYEKIPILGEEYLQRVDPELDDVVGKVPYLYINIDVDEYERFGSANGLKDAVERERTLLDAIKMVRPVNIVVVFVLTIPRFEDEIDSEIKEDYELDYTYPSVYAGLDEDKVYNHYRLGEYFTHGEDDYVYIWNREEYEKVPQDMFSVYSSSINPLLKVNTRDHAFIKMKTKVVNGEISYRHTSDDRMKVYNDEADYETFRTVERDTEYKTNITTSGNISFGEMVPGKSERDVTKYNYFVFSDHIEIEEADYRYEFEKYVETIRESYAIEYDDLEYRYEFEKYEEDGENKIRITDRVENGDWENDDYYNDVNVVSNTSFASNAIGQVGSTPWFDYDDFDYDRIRITDNGDPVEWYNEIEHDKVLLNKNAFNIDMNDKFAGDSSVDIEFFSMLHRTIGSPKFKTKYKREGKAYGFMDGSMVEVNDDTLRRDCSGSGWIIESDSTNLLRYTSDFKNSYWNPIDVDVEEDGTTPYGNPLYKIRKTKSGRDKGLQVEVGSSVGTSSTSKQEYVLSVISKSGSTDTVAIKLEEGSNEYIIRFNTSDHTFEVSGANDDILDMFYVDIDDNMYRIAVRFMSAYDGLFITLLAENTSAASGRYSYFGDIQLERSDFTSYMKSETGFGKRESDELWIEKIPEQLNQSAILCDFETWNDGTVFYLDGDEDSIVVSVNDGSININGEKAFDYEYGTIGNLAIQIEDDNLDVWFIDHNEDRHDYSLGYTPSDAALYIGQNNNKMDHINGVIYDVYFSTDDLKDGHYSEFFDKVLKGYRDGDAYQLVQ